MCTNFNKNTTDNAIAENRLKALPVKGLGLKYPINDSRSLPSRCLSPSPLQYDLVLGSPSLDLHNVQGFLSGFVFFFKNSLGKKRFSSKYTPTLNMLLANLRLAHLDGKQLLTPLRRESSTLNNPEKIKYPTVNNVLNQLADNGYINLVKGKANEYQNICTWCEPTPALIHWFESHSFRAQLHIRADLVTINQTIKDVTSGKEKKVTVPILKKDKQQANHLAATVRAHNETWFNQIATLDGKYVTPWCKRKFNDTLEYGGRFYGGYQQLTKAQRGRILINDMPTAEPDFSGYHINILYAWEQKKIPGKPYEIANYTRDTVKAVMLPLLNTKNLNQLAGHVNKSAKPETKARYAQWKDLSAANQLRVAQGAKCENLRKPDFLKGFIEGIPEDTDGHELIEAIKQKHPVIAHHFGTDKLGVRLQNYDSNIMANILNTLSQMNIAALPVHDSIRCLGSESLRVAEIMKSEYKLITGFDIKVS